MSDELTVEACLDELRNMFGHNQAVTISRFERWSMVAPHHLNWNVSIGTQRVTGTTLRDALDEALRTFKQSQAKEQSG